MGTRSTSTTSRCCGATAASARPPPPRGGACRTLLPKPKGGGPRGAWPAAAWPASRKRAQRDSRGCAPCSLVTCAMQPACEFGVLLSATLTALLALRVVHPHNRAHGAFPADGAVGPRAPLVCWPWPGGNSEGSPGGRGGRRDGRLAGRWLGLVPSLMGAGVLLGLVSVGVGWVRRRPASSTRRPTAPAPAAPCGCDASRAAGRCAS